MKPIDIDSMVKRFAPDAHGKKDSPKTEHDNIFARELIAANNMYAGTTTENLKELQLQATTNYRLNGPTHKSTAQCLVLAELIKVNEGP